MEAKDLRYSKYYSEPLTDPRACALCAINDFLSGLWNYSFNNFCHLLSKTFDNILFSF